VPQKAEVCQVSQFCTWLCIQYMSAGADIKLVELVGEHTVLCDYKDADCTVQENINLGKHQDSII